MSVDFGPIPMPSSPMQDYFERKFKTASETSSPAIPVSPTGSEQSIHQELEAALFKLAEKQRKDGSTSEEETVKTDKGMQEPRVSWGTQLQRRDSSATSTGTAFAKAGHLKRRSTSGAQLLSALANRRPSG